MHHVPQAGLTKPAVAGQLERGVRHQRCGARICVGTIKVMLITFDPAKNARNVAERGIPFRMALRLDWATALLAEDLRKDYGEQRFQAVGLIGERLHVVLFTPRPPALHVISLRKANKREEARYEAQA
jgi:uncharacterized protein